MRPQIETDYEAGQSQQTWAEAGGARNAYSVQRVGGPMHMLLLGSYILAVSAMSLLMRWYIGGLLD